MERNFNAVALRSLLNGFYSFISNLNKSDDILDMHGDLEFFVGGSFRFGYLNGNSDLDLFLLVPKNLGSFITMIRRHGFITVTDTYYEGTSSISLRHNIQPIHLNVIGSITTFNKIALEHLSIDSFLEKNPLMIKVIKGLKAKFGLKGSQVYKFLISIVMEQKLVSEFIKTE